MLTVTMNKVEIQRKMVDFIKRKQNLLRPIAEKFEKEIRKIPKISCSKTKPLKDKSYNDEYILSCLSIWGSMSIVLYAKIDHGKNVWYYMISDDLTETMNAYSVHFYKRYAERMNIPFLMPNIISKHAVRNPNMFKMYSSDDGVDVVYASDEGIELCRWDEKRGITKFCTFVPKSMLKPTQMEAWEVVEHKITEANGYLKSNMSEREKMQAINKWSDSSSVIVELATEVYKQYYNELENE